MHKSILAVAALMLGGLAAGGCTEPAPTAYTYTSEAEGFSLTFPSDWPKSTGGYGMNLEIQPPGQDAWRLAYSYKNPIYDTPVTSITYFLSSGLRGYVIAANAGSDRFAERKAKFEEILWTFKLLGAPAATATPVPAPAATQ